MNIKKLVLALIATAFVVSVADAQTARRAGMDGNPLIALMVSGKNLIAPCVMDFHRVTTSGHPNDITAANNCPAFMFKVPNS